MKPHGYQRRQYGRSERIEREQEVLTEGAMEINPDELREFLEADLLGDQADPAFKEELRRKLWALVRTKYGKAKPGGGES